MELADVSSVSMLERPDPLYVICLNDHALYTDVLWWISHQNQRLHSYSEEFVARYAVGMLVWYAKMHRLL
jgi:hypothetical protein